MVMTLLAKDGPSKLFVEGFDQYLTQTANCNNCQTSGQVYAIFEVEGASQLTLLPGSTQGLTQTATQNGANLINTVYDRITVTGGADATIFLDHQIENVKNRLQVLMVTEFRNLTEYILADQQLAKVVYSIQMVHLLRAMVVRIMLLNQIFFSF